MDNPPSTPRPSVETLIQVDNVSVSYRSYKERPSSLKESLIRLVRHGSISKFSTFRALSDVSFTVERGLVFGLMGSNGSGKSTLLKVIAQVLKPTVGSVAVRGTIASLIELGVGFDPEQTAVENIFLHGSLHKRSYKEIERRVNHILDFAELRDFASTPVKYFSSGMAARLGFSVAIDTDPDILLVDEVLAVGDERFHEKCMGVFRQLLSNGKTIVLVSHDANMLAKLCNRIGLLSRGQLIYCGDPQKAIELYRTPEYQTALGVSQASGHPGGAA